MTEKNRSTLSLIEETMLDRLQNMLKAIQSETDENGNPRKMTIEELIDQEKQKTIAHHNSITPTENFNRAAINLSRDQHLAYYKHIEDYLKLQKSKK